MVRVARSFKLYSFQVWMYIFMIASDLHRCQRASLKSARHSAATCLHVLFSYFCFVEVEMKRAALCRIGSFLRNKQKIWIAWRPALRHTDTQTHTHTHTHTHTYTHTHTHTHTQHGRQAVIFLQTAQRAGELVEALAYSTALLQSNFTSCYL